MKAMVSTQPGGPETLSLVERDVPAPGQNKVTIAVRAIGVNFPDTLIIRDLYQFKPQRPFSPGSEVSGVIEAVGEGVTDFVPGDRVVALDLSGGFATHLETDAVKVFKIPKDMPFDEAAAFITAYGTSQYALIERAKISAGEVLFVLGAAGGVGAAAVEIGKALGAHVIAGVSSEEKAAFCKELGADETIIYPCTLDKDGQRALSKEIKAKAVKLGRPEGADVVYDGVGGDYAEPAIRSLGWDGRFLVIGFPAGIPAIPLNLPLLKSCHITGVIWGLFTMRDTQRHHELINELFKMYTEGKIRPRVTETFPLEEAAKALTLMEERKVRGKIVLTV
ncbi:MAG: NADPH:quinone oxidoreductase family protein [Pseudomonadota bacterium]